MYKHARRRRRYRRYPLLTRHIIAFVRHYRTLTTRFLFYLLVSRYPRLYPNDRRTYKSVVYRSTKLRRADPKLNGKFIDPTRHFIEQNRPYHPTELWMEKDSLRPMVMPLARLHRVNVLVLRGFISYSAVSRALRRAEARHIELILFIGDLDPSGVSIEEAAQREMRIKFRRIMLTYEQATRLKLIPMRVNRRDSRWRKYVQKYGDESWEVESVRPRTFRKILEEALKQAVPPAFLEKMKLRDRASAIARPHASKLVRLMEADVRRWLRRGLHQGEIRRRLQERYRP